MTRTEKLSLSLFSIKRNSKTGIPKEITQVIIAPSNTSTLIVFSDTNPSTMSVRASIQKTIRQSLQFKSFEDMIIFR